MIPFQIFCARLKFQNGDEIEVRGLELMPEGFSFRLVKDYMNGAGFVCEAVCSFYHWNSQRYEHVKLSMSEMLVMLTAKEEHYDVFYLKSKNSKFQEFINKLSREYLDYIECKLELEDDELSNIFSNYPKGKDDDFFADRKSQYKAWAEEINNSIDLESFSWMEEKENNINFYVHLENDYLIERFLCKPIQEFAKNYWSEAGLSDHPFSRMSVSGIIIGNGYCDELTPDIKVIKSIISKCGGENLKTRIAIPPVREEKLSQYEELCKLKTEITEILLCKQYRDPRSAYLLDSDCLNANIMLTKDCVFIPFYQTNTGTFCPLYGAVVNKARGRQEQIDKCSKICSQYNFMYPKHLNMIGRYNSLFGINKDILVNGAVLKELYSNGISQVVFNL